MVRKATLVGATLVALLAGSLVSTGLLAPAASASEAGQVTPRVVGGTVAANGSWPSQAYVEIEVEPGVFSFCGGTLIEPNWILTAAHCVVRGGDAVPASSVLTAIGKNDLRAIEGSDVLGIRSISVHPDYLSLRSGDRWDFALLELERASTQPTTALIAPGQESLTVGGQPGSIAGWGCTSQVPPGGSCPASPPLPSDLIEAQVSFVSDSECESPFPTSYGGGFDREIMICAGNFETGLPDTCFGDSGGPLIAFGPGGERLLAGITSFGYGCATPSFPGVYAKVLAGRDWILRTIGTEFGLEVTTGGTGQGTVTSNPAGIACGPTCSADFPYGTEVTLTAKADSGSGFTGWNGACSGTESCTVTIGAATQVGAEFRKAPTVSLKAKPAKRTSSRTAKFRFKSSQSGATFQCRIDGKSWSKCKSPRTYRNLKRGRKHTFRVKARKDGITGPVRQYVWFVRK